METYKIKIVKCSRPVFWYNNLIGKTFVADTKWGKINVSIGNNPELNEYMTNVRGFVSGMLDYGDYEIIEETA